MPDPSATFAALIEKRNEIAGRIETRKQRTRRRRDFGDGLMEQSRARLEYSRTLLSLPVWDSHRLQSEGHGAKSDRLAQPERKGGLTASRRGLYKLAVAQPFSRDRH